MGGVMVEYRTARFAGPAPAMSPAGPVGRAAREEHRGAGRRVKAPARRILATRRLSPEGLPLTLTDGGSTERAARVLALHAGRA